MKRPTTRREQLQMYALIGIGAVAVLYAVYAFVYVPLRESRIEAEAEIERLENILRAAQAQIRQSDDLSRELVSRIREVHEMSEQYMLHPRLGNYLLQARDIIQLHGQHSHVLNPRIEEIGLVALPARRGSRARDHQVQGFSVRVHATCTYDQLVEWLSRLEAANPLVLIQHLNIAARTESPEQHRVRFEVQWPVWIDPALRQEVQAQKTAAVNAPDHEEPDE